MSEPRLVLIIAVVVVLVVLFTVAAVAARRAKQRRSERLRRRFGPEYDRLVVEQGTASRAEAALEERERRARKIIIRPLPAAETETFAEAWRTVQAQFVDNPRHAVAEADRLIEEVMSRRGYPVGNFELQAADLSVDHPVGVQNYRSAHEIAEHNRNGGTSTEELRKAMVHYRKLYEELLNPGHHSLNIEVKR
jgi:hypothetical protein